MFSLVPQAYAKINPETFGKFIDPIIANVVNPAIMLLFAIGIVVFVYGVLEMIIKGGDPDARKTGRYHMLGGLIGMFIMLSAWGIIYLVANTLRDI